jgi:hypothetical protein
MGMLHKREYIHLREVFEFQVKPEAATFTKSGAKG